MVIKYQYVARQSQACFSNVYTPYRRRPTLIACYGAARNVGLSTVREREELLAEKTQAAVANQDLHEVFFHLSHRTIRRLDCLLFIVHLHI